MLEARFKGIFIGPYSINSAQGQTVPSTQVKYRLQCLPDTNNCGEDGTDPHINQTFIHSQSCCQSLPATFHFHMNLAGKITQNKSTLVFSLSACCERSNYPNNGCNTFLCVNAMDGTHFKNREMSH